MKLSHYRILLAAVAVVGTLILLFPTLNLIIRVPQPEKTTELWLLGPGHMATDYPFDVQSNENYSVYLGMGNREGSSARYSVLVKLRDQTESSPVNSTPSSLDPVYEYGFLVSDNNVLERNIIFSFFNISFQNQTCFILGFSIDGHSFTVEKTLNWDNLAKGYFCQLFFELYLYDLKTTSFKYYDRYVALWLNVTSPSHT